MEAWNAPLQIEELTPELLVRLYANGLFPMAESRHDRSVFLVSPTERGLLPIEGLHIPKRLQKTILKTDLIVRADTAFRQVMELCAEQVKGRLDTWINDSILESYTQLFDMNLAHSIEVWTKDDELVGGLYGVSLHGAFFGESMVSRQRDASKIALVHLVARLRLGGYQLLDTQFITNHLSQFGAYEIPAREYLPLLEMALDEEAHFPVIVAPSEERRMLKIMFEESRQLARLRTAAIDAQ